MAERSLDYDLTFCLRRGEKEFQVSVNTPVTVAMLSRMFDVETSSVWLRDYVTSRVHLPNEEGLFSDLQPHDLSRLIVEGRDSNPPHVGTTLSATSSPGFSRTGAQGIGDSGSGSGSRWPGFRSVAPALRPRVQAEAKCFIKIVKTKMSKLRGKGKAVFDPLDQTFVELTDRDANVDFICKHIADTWGNNWILVSGDGIEISDCPATRGEHRNLAEVNCKAMYLNTYSITYILV